MIRFTESFDLVTSSGAGTDQYVLASWSNWYPYAPLGVPSSQPLSDYLSPGAGPIGQTCFLKILDVVTFGQGGLAKTLPILPDQTSLVVGGYFRARDNIVSSIAGLISIKAAFANYAYNDFGALIPASGISEIATDLISAADYSLSLRLGGMRQTELPAAVNWQTGQGPFMAAGAITENVWHFLEIKLDWSDGSLLGCVHIDGIESLGPTTSIAALTTDGQPLQWLSPISVSVGFWGIDFTGIYVLDNLPSHDGSTIATDFLGEVVILGLSPVADGSRTDWTPDTGTDQFARVVPPQDGDTSYVATANVGASDTFKFQPTVVHEGKRAFPAKLIYGVAVKAFARKADNDLHQVAGTCISGPSVGIAPSGVVLSTQYTTDFSAFEVNPATGEPWDNTTVDAAEFGATLIA